jgi:hypothetical protein
MDKQKTLMQKNLER